MKRLLRLAMVGLAVLAGPADAQGEDTKPFIDPIEEVFNELAFTARNAGWTGEIGILVETGENSQRLLFTGEQDARRLPWASVTKQVIATMVMQQVERGRLQLDAPLITYIPLPAEGDVPSPTIRQVLQHRSGLRNPEGPDGGDTRFYRSGLSRTAATQWCLTDRATPPQQGWSYNNCDYIVLGTLLEAVTGEDFDQLLADYITLPAQMRTTSLSDPASEPARARPEGLAGYGTSAALVGSVEDMLRFSLALLEGKLLSNESRSEMWGGDPQLSYMALGQWSYSAPLRGCKAPQRIIERRGGIGQYQALHLMLPDKARALVLLGPAPDTDFGAIWASEGLAYDLISMLACKDL